jgi:hypothetical protein
MSTRLAGHELLYEGAAHDSLGNRTRLLYGGTSGEGRAKCSCGVLSKPLTSGRARKAWHRDHKADVLAASRESR